MWWYQIDPRFKTYEAFTQQSEYWFMVKYFYEKSNLPKYCYICDSPLYQLHHEDYDVLGRELKKNFLGNWIPQWDWIRKLVPLCDDCHNLVHQDEEGDQVPLEFEFLHERRIELRKQFKKNLIIKAPLYLLPAVFIKLQLREIYRTFH